MKNNKILTLLSVILVPAAIYIFLICYHGVDNFFIQLNQLNINWLIGACLCMVLYWILESHILNIMIRLFKNKQSYKGSLKTTMIGQFFNSITPFASGGQPMQIYYLVNSENISAGCASSVLLLKFVIYQFVLTIYSLLFLIIKFTYFNDRISHLIFLALLGFLLNASIIIICFIFMKSKNTARKIIVGCIKILKFIKIVKNTDSLTKTIEHEIENFHNGVLLLRANIKFWLTTSILTVLQLTFFYIIPYCIYRSFEYKGNLINIISAQAFVQMVVSFIPIPGSSGAAEGSFYVFFQLFFTSETIALAVLLWRIITYYSCILFGGITMLFPVLKTSLNKL